MDRCSRSFLRRSNRRTSRSRSCSSSRRIGTPRPRAPTSSSWERPRARVLFSGAAHAADRERALATNPDPWLTIASAAAAVAGYPSPEALEAGRLRLEVGGKAAIEDLVAKFSTRGFERMPVVSARGQYAVRGDLIDVFDGLEERPLRIELLGRGRREPPLVRSGGPGVGRGRARGLGLARTGGGPGLDRGARRAPARQHGRRRAGSAAPRGRDGGRHRSRRRGRARRRAGAPRRAAPLPRGGRHARPRDRPSAR